MTEEKMTIIEGYTIEEQFNNLIKLFEDREELDRKKTKKLKQYQELSRGLLMILLREIEDNSSLNKKQKEIIDSKIKTIRRLI